LDTKKVLQLIYQIVTLFLFSLLLSDINKKIGLISKIG